jgi:hypothetical protein
LVSNPAYAVGDYNNQTWNNDIDYYKTTIDDSGIYADSTLTDWHWMIAGNPNNGDTTDDGFCFMYDGGNYGGTPFAVYNAIDITQCAFYNNPEYQNIEWYSFSDLNMIAEPDTSPIGIYQGQQAYVGVVDSDTNIFGNGAEYWSGCYATGDGATWADNQNGGGDCPIINNDSDQINWGYMQQSLTQISAFDTALKNAGLETYGYTYSWMVKNADANFEDSNGVNAQDTMTVTLAVRDNGGNIVYKKEFDYSYWINTWTQFSGDENFDRPFDVSTLESVMLEVTGQDVGNWDGYYGPEFNNPNVKLKFRPIIEDNTEQLLLEQMCMNDPLYDVNCPGYQTAMMEQMNEAAGTTDLTGGMENELTAALDAGGTNVFDNDLGTIEADAAGTGVPDPTGVEDAAGTPDPTGVEEAVAEAVEPVAEAVAEAAEPVAEEVAAAEPEAAANSAEEKKSGGLSATQQNALNAASAVANSAVGTAGDAASASAGIGLSETGGVSSTLTSVDPTGSTNALGGMSGSSQDFGSTGDGSTGTSITSLTQEGTSSSSSSFSNPGLSNEGNDGLDAQSTGFAAVPGTETAPTGMPTQDSQGLTSSVADGSSTTDPTGSPADIASLDITGSDMLNTGNPLDTIGQPTTDGFDVSAVEQSVVDQSAEQAEIASVAAMEETNNAVLIAEEETNSAIEQSATSALAQTFAPGNPIDELIKEMTTAIIQAAVDDANEVAEESAKESFEDQNKKEDNLVEQAQNGSDDEDAKAALLGYNPKIRAYQQEQAYAGKDIYSDQGMYEDQKTYDNPNARLFNGASDALHREMVRSQYELGN